MNLSTRSIVLGASGTAVVAAVVVGLALLGPPAQERERRIDDRRAADLHGIVAATDLYRARHGRLPASLDELAAEPGLRISTRDPTSSELYGYRALDDGRYEVCATFAAESEGPTGSTPVLQRSCQGCHAPGSPFATRVDDPAAARLGLREPWAHGSGQQCFQMRVSPALPGGGDRDRRDRIRGGRARQPLHVRHQRHDQLQPGAGCDDGCGRDAGGRAVCAAGGRYLSWQPGPNAPGMGV